MRHTYTRRNSHQLTPSTTCTLSPTRVVKVSELARSVSSEAMGRINRIKAELHTAKEEALRARRRARHASDQVGGGLLRGPWGCVLLADVVSLLLRAGVQSPPWVLGCAHCTGSCCAKSTKVDLQV